jgi:hypothetical protein
MEMFRFRRRGWLWLLAAIFFVTMFSMTRERPWADATPIWELADSMATNGSISIHTRWPGKLPLGSDGKVYAAAPLLQGLIHVPGAFLQRQIAAFAPLHAQLAWRFTSHLGTALLGALTCVLFFGLCRRLGTRPLSAGLATVALGLGTTLWVYARYPYSEVLQAACFTGFFGQLLKTRQDPSRRNGAFFGLWVGLLVNAKYVYLASVAMGALYLIWTLRGRWRTMLETAMAALVAGLPFAAMILLYNYARWGSVTNAGYNLSSGAGISENVAVGLWGLFLSPGKSVFLYSPPLVAGILGLPRAARRWPHFLPAFLLVLIPPLLVNARLIFWSGDYAWGPRYLVFAIPVMLLPLALILDDCLSPRRGLLWRLLVGGSVAGVVLLGGFVQYLGNAFYWDHFIRIQAEASHAWLGRPDSKGSGLLDPSTGCGACFEEMHPMQWLPPFQPIMGHYWMLWHALNEDDWAKAEADAPWHRYTSNQLNIASTWHRVRLDWWFPEYRDRLPKVSWTLVIGFPLLALLGFALFFYELWRASKGQERAQRLASPPVQVYDPALTAST